MERKEFKVTYRFMAVLVIVVGFLGIISQFIPGFEDFSIFLLLAVLGGWIGGSKDYEALEQRQLERSYKAGVGGLLLIVLVAYALIVLARGLPLLTGAAAFLNRHWPTLMLSSLCVLLGLAGTRRARSA